MCQILYLVPGNTRVSKICQISALVELMFYWGNRQ